MSTGLVVRNPRSSILEVAKVMVDLNVSSVAIIQADEEEYGDAERQQNNKELIGY